MSSFLGVVRALLLCLLVSAVAAKDACKKPKVRREWRKLTHSERAEWIGAVNCLAALPHDPRLAPSVPANISLIPPVNETSSFFDDIVYLHMDLNVKIHWTGMFFPWHRYYLQFFEDALVKRCGYNGTSPYWDWSLDAHDLYNSDMFDDSPSGIGAWGDPANDYQISTGGLKDIILAYPNPHHIRRNLTILPFTTPNYPEFVFPGDPASPPLPDDLMVNTTMTKQNVEYTVNNFEGNFTAFQAYVEALPTDSTPPSVGIHGGAHLAISGDLSGFCPNGAVPPACVPGPRWSSNDPLFFMHHAMIDKLWYDWQKKSPKNKNSYGGGSGSPLSDYATYKQFPTGLPPFLNVDSQLPGDGLWNNVTVRDMMDTTGDTLCYIYA